MYNMYNGKQQQETCRKTRAGAGVTISRQILASGEQLGSRGRKESSFHSAV
jgi:hypothetical protein